MPEWEMKSEITLLDYLLAIPVAIYFWCAEHLDKSERCKKSPKGTHFFIAKDFKSQCKWCGRIEVPKRDARGK
ncbi:unnamed protein product [marine sediment metagenome]|uniref:Uncharacterized protein n=1 Tax=marine sediment metagenome TaxID=412755 RepID=X1RR03_9ZZZZ